MSGLDILEMAFWAVNAVLVAGAIWNLRNGP